MVWGLYQQFVSTLGEDGGSLQVRYTLVYSNLSSNNEISITVKEAAT